MTARPHLSPNHRHLLLFAPSADDDRLARMERALERHATAVSDRDLQVHRAAGDAATGPAGRDTHGAGSSGPAPHDDPATLRDSCDVPPDAFCLILVGKDGGEKLRRWEPVDLEEIFALIDAMPMRRREMRERGR